MPVISGTNRPSTTRISRLAEATKREGYFTTWYIRRLIGNRRNGASGGTGNMTVGLLSYILIRRHAYKIPCCFMACWTPLKKSKPIRAGVVIVVRCEPENAEQQ